MRTRVGRLVAPRRPNPRRVQPRPQRRGTSGFARAPYWFAGHLCTLLGHKPVQRTIRDTFLTCLRCRTAPFRLTTTPEPPEPTVEVLWIDGERITR